MRHPARFRLLLRILLIGVALPCVYLGGASAAFYYRQRVANQSADLLRLPIMAAPAASTRLLVIAPHCDDETLGCAGLIQQTLAAGGCVETVIVTNGDGYPAAVERQQRVLKAGPKDYIEFAGLRQRESSAAMSSLGLQKNATLFLGYPDTGLAIMWNNDWNRDAPYRSTFTECVQSPYSDTFHSKSLYCGDDLVRDLKSVMQAFRPTLIAATHPAEDHLDHAATASFTTLALEELQSDPANQGWSRKTDLVHYMIHRGDWPMPQGRGPNLPLAPPHAMMTVDTDWRVLPLTMAQVNKKTAEIASYPSQTSIMPDFLNSFARKNELFGTISQRELAVVPDASIHIDGKDTDWNGITPCIIDAARDNVLRDLQGGGDLLALYCARDSTNLYLRVTVRCPVSSRFRYLVRLRPFGPHWESPDGGMQIVLGPGPSRAESDGVTTVSTDKTIEAAIPWSRVASGLDTTSIRAIAVSAETSLSSVEIDRTETRLLTLPSTPATARQSASVKRL